MGGISFIVDVCVSEPTAFAGAGMLRFASPGDTNAAGAEIGGHASGDARAAICGRS
jgi:hypothetical protein